jgi:transposase InsO family protein
MRQQRPRWGKEKIAKLLNEESWKVSISMVGRILKRLRDRGVLREPIWNMVSVKRRQRQRPYATRKPKEYQAKEPGDIVQLDTMDVRPLPGVIIKHFTARDVVSRWDVLEAHTRASSAAATGFIHTMLSRMPFPIRAIQVDGGSEFMAEFEEECQRLGIKLFVLPPRSPKLNGHVERAHRTHTEEFYEVTDSSFEIAELNRALLDWEKVYNTIRPHQSLGYMTPQGFLAHLGQHKRKGVMCH